MDDVKVGLVIRAVRLRRGWRQADVAEAAGVSQTFVSLIERGGLRQTSVGSIRRLCEALGIHVSLDLGWRGGDLARLCDERHAALVLAVSRRLAAAGWEATVERTYSIYGERGSIDIVAWHPGRRAFLVVEVKSEIVDLQDLFAAFDRKRRLAPRIAREMELCPVLFGALIAFAEESGARKSVERFRPLFERSYPARALAIRRWLAEPTEDLRGLWFLPISNARAGRRRRGGPRRVRRPRAASVQT